MRYVDEEDTKSTEELRQSDEWHTARTIRHSTVLIESISEIPLDTRVSIFCEDQVWRDGTVSELSDDPNAASVRIKLW